ncbi:hypothetical protein, partial [Paenibacillus sp. An7]|uniref:hypothetical protein n=1 Tax=Paenibacillus sp. An7 TaxID=2689577 RepID=UPI001F3331B5
MIHTSVLNPSKREERIDFPMILSCMSFLRSDILLVSIHWRYYSAKILFGGDSGGVPHVPIPNTTV